MRLPCCWVEADWADVEYDCMPLWLPCSMAPLEAILPTLSECSSISIGPKRSTMSAARSTSGSESALTVTTHLPPETAPS